MQYDEIINCPKSGGDLCYKIQVNEDIINYFSLSCGFWTNSLMKIGNEFYEEQMSILPELYKAISWIDQSTELVWIPNTVNEPTLGMVFAEGNSANKWSWASVRTRELTAEEQKETGLTHKPDMTTKKNFEERDYIEALSYIGVLPE
jgi:hypothetical protein